MNENKQEKVYFDFKKVLLESEKQEKKQKRNHILIYVGVGTFLIVLGFAIGIIFSRALHPVNTTDPRNTFGEIEAVLQNYYLYKDNYEDFNTELQDKAFYGMTSFDDDPYTSYMSKDELNEFASSINMDYVGIGVVYSLQDGFGVVQRVVLNSPAEKAGILAGDIIIKIDGETVEGLTTDEIKQEVIGEAGTIVKITVLRSGKETEFDVTRGEIENSVYCFTQDNYVVMNIYSFGESTGKECVSYLDQYVDYKNIIIDIRNNTGGYQNSVAEVAGLFIGNKEVYLRQIDAYGNETKALTSCSKTYDNFDNIVILVNEGTASAAEVLAICLKEKLDNVTIVGTNTFGKGVIQSTHYLANGGALKFTSYKWTSPNGVSINGVGVTPDEEVKMDDVYYALYVSMQEDEKYEYDSVSEANKIVQLCFEYLDYDVDRYDGYFDLSTVEALYAYKIANNLETNRILDKETYDNIVSTTLSNIYKGVKDYQMDRAIQLMNK